MKIFVDSAKLDEIREAFSWGITDGVTTNPTHIKTAVDAEKAKGKKVDMEEHIRQILTAADGPVSLEVIGVTTEDMVKQARYLYNKFNSIKGNVVIKIPITTSVEEGDGRLFAGVKAIKQLSMEGIPTNATLIFSPEQALLAAKAGAAYASPFSGRLDDYIRDNLGMTLGKDYQKADYFDYSYLQGIVAKKLDSAMEKSKDRDVAELFQDEDLKRLFNSDQDKGILSGVDLVEKIVIIYDNYDMTTEIIAASMRNGPQIREIAETGADIVSAPFDAIKDMVNHFKTVEGLKTFLKNVVPEYADLFKNV